jgi:hypothetical protein
MTGSQIRLQISRIIDSLVVDNNPEVLDDDIADLQADADQRSEAIDDLINMINNYRKDL